MQDYFQPMEPAGLYHVYNRGNNGDRLFYKNENYAYFLKRLDWFLSPIVDIFAYCLLPNHFHLLLRVKAEGELFADPCLQDRFKPAQHPSIIISEQFRRFFLSYAKAIKEQEGRTGSLFEKNFKRKLVTNDAYAVKVINYIHRNPETHGIVQDFRMYPHSSYRSFLSDTPTRLQRQAVLELFGGKGAFIAYHAANPVLKPDEVFD